MAKSFSNLSRDGSQTAMQTGRGIATQDATASPQTSPFTLPSASITTISVPSNAAELVMFCATAFKVSEDSTVTRYFMIPASTTIAIPLSGTDTIYLQASTGTPTLYFYFVTV